MENPSSTVNTFTAMRNISHVHIRTTAGYKTKHLRVVVIKGTHHDAIYLNSLVSYKMFKRYVVRAEQ
jgi:hypothetical protein